MGLLFMGSKGRRDPPAVEEEGLLGKDQENMETGV